MLNKFHKYNFYSLENKVAKGSIDFINYLEEVFISEGIEKVIEIIKASGIAVNLFHSPKRKEYFEEVISHFKMKSNTDQLNEILKLEVEVSYFEYLYEKLSIQKDMHFNKYIKLTDNNRVVSYLIALELYLKEITKPDTDSSPRRLEYQNRSNLFDLAGESTGIILNYFIYKKCQFKGAKKNISPKNIDLSTEHVFFSGVHKFLSEILDYWKYSNVEVNKNNKGIISFKINDEEFEYNNLISNERFHNLREDWQISAKNKIIYDQENYDENFKVMQSNLNQSFTKLYFGASSLEMKIEGIELKKWVYAYELLVEESKVFLNRSQNLNVLNLEKTCIVKSKYKWAKFFCMNGFSKKEAEIIIKIFTFTRGNLDLLDAPFVEIDDSLVVIPSLTSQCAISQALASNFNNQKINLSFRGPEFENKIIHELRKTGLKTGSLYKKINVDEYECDIAFILNDDLYLIECKAHIQPFTIRQHADHLKKLYDATSQLNRISNFFSNNINFVKEQLNLSSNFQPQNVYRILLTTSMVGSPLLINGVYITDETAFITFLSRSSPSLNYRDSNVQMKVSSQKFKEYEGEITSQKMINFLASPAAIQIARDFFKEQTISTDVFQVTRKSMRTPSIHYGIDFDSSDKALMTKFFS